MIKAIAFDLDHTLYDRNATYVNMGDSFCSVLKDYIRKGATKEELVHILQTADRDGIYYDDWKGIYRKACLYGVFEKEPGFETFFSYIFDWFPASIKAYPDTYETLMWCSVNGYTPVIITNGFENFQMKKIKALRLDCYVDKIIIGGAIGFQKPAPEPFLAMAVQLGIHPSQMVYVGDNPVNDIDGSRHAGLIPVWIRSVGTWPEGLEPAPYRIDTLSELPETVSKIKATFSGVF